MAEFPWTRFPPVAAGIATVQYACVANGVSLGGLLQAFAIGSDGRLYTAWQDTAPPGGWVPWEVMTLPPAGITVTVPAVVAAVIGIQLWVAILGDDGNLWATCQQSGEPGAWTAWANIGAPPAQLGPKVVFSAGVVSGESIGGIWAVGYNDGQLWSVWPDPAAASGWGNWIAAGTPGTRLYSLTSFCLGVDTQDLLHCFAIAVDGTVWDLSGPLASAPGGWGAWAQLPVPAGNTAPTIVTGQAETLDFGAMITNTDANGNLEVYVVDDTGTLWGVGQTAQVAAPAVPAWSPWVTLGAPAAGIAPGPVGLAASHDLIGIEVLVAVDTAGQTWGIFNWGGVQAPGPANSGLLAAWSTWTQIGADELSDIKTAVNADGRIELFALGSKQLCHVWELTPNADDFVGCCYANLAASNPEPNNDVSRTNWGIVDLPTSGGMLFAPILFQPTDVYGIAAAITQAENDGQPARALGSGWSFSDVSFPQTSSFNDLQFAEDILTFNYADIWQHAGYAIDISACSNTLDSSSVLLPDVDPSLLWFTEAGITIEELNNTLARLPEPLALKTMGGSAGQTLAGAISTGTHGSDFDRAPLADQVRALYIVGAGGVHHWVEPSAPITDPEMIAASFPCLAPPNIHYDDDLFHSALVAMGSMGVIYAVIICVVPQYALAQVTFEVLWEETTGSVSGPNSLFSDAWLFRGQLDATFDQPPTYRALQLLVNPIKNADGTHNCYVTARFEVPLGDIPDTTALPSGPQSQDLSALTTSAIQAAIEAQPEWDAGAAIAFAFANISGATTLEKLQSLINFCKSYNYYWAVRGVIDLAMQNALPLNTIPLNPQLDLGFKVMAGNVLGTNFSIDQVTSIEAFFAYPDAAAFVTSMLAAIDANIPNNIFPAGYISLRSCGPTSALLGMEQFGTLPFNPAIVRSVEGAECCGAVEMSMMSNDDDIGVLQTFENLALNQGGNLHWGQSNGLLSSSMLNANYTGLTVWRNSRRQLGGTTFESLFTARLGLG